MKEEAISLIKAKGSITFTEKGLTLAGMREWLQGERSDSVCSGEASRSSTPKRTPSRVENLSSSESKKQDQTSNGGENKARYDGAKVGDGELRRHDSMDNFTLPDFDLLNPPLPHEPIEKVVGSSSRGDHMSLRDFQDTFEGVSLDDIEGYEVVLQTTQYQVNSDEEDGVERTEWQWLGDGCRMDHSLGNGSQMTRSRLAGVGGECYTTAAYLLDSKLVPKRHVRNCLRQLLHEGGGYAECLIGLILNPLTERIQRGDFVNDAKIKVLVVSFEGFEPTSLEKDLRDKPYCKSLISEEGGILVRSLSFQLRTKLLNAIYIRLSLLFCTERFYAYPFKHTGTGSVIVIRI